MHRKLIISYTDTEALSGHKMQETFVYYILWGGVFYSLSHMVFHTNILKLSELTTLVKDPC
jgi:hypothetical protein